MMHFFISKFVRTAHSPTIALSAGSVAIVTPSHNLLWGRPRNHLCSEQLLLRMVFVGPLIPSPVTPTPFLPSSVSRLRTNNQQVLMSLFHFSTLSH
jgi:hypothetical protein